MTSMTQRAPAAPRERSHTLDVDGVAVGVREWGSGPPVVLLHGFIGSAAYWDGTARRLARSRRVIAVDLPGHGASAPLEPFTLDGASALLARTPARIGADAPALVGHSLGAALAVVHAAANPVRGLVLASPVGLLPLRVAHARWALPVGQLLARRLEWPCCTFAPLRRLAFGWFVGMARLERLSPAHARELLRAAEQASPAVRGYLPALRELDVSAEVSRVRAPVLVVYGERDGVAAGNAALLTERLGARLVVLPETGHMPMIEAPHAFTAALREIV
jgi:pimeloyl-ACP methyl ester carboxylesterase